MKTRDIIAVTTLSILTLCTWPTMFGIAHMKVWNRTFALATIKASGPSAELLHSREFLEQTYLSYLTKRYVYYLPHIIGAFLWWNLFFLQLIPPLRRKYKKLHRWMGRMLLLAVLSQVLSGVCLAYNGFSAIIAWFSYIVGFATVICVYHTATKARAKDFHMHKYWALRLVGYLQAISAQRFWIMLAIGCQYAGAFRNMEHPLYPQLEEDSPQSLADTVVLRMFHDSFVAALVSAFIGTELYLAAAMMDNAFGGKGTTSEVQQGSKNGDYSKLSTEPKKSYKSID